jgi:hypothetical protein
MRRFIITVLIATVLHAVACIIAPPFEFGHNRAECFFFASVSGLLGFPVMFAVVLCPCGGDCADLCRRGCSAHKPSLPGWCFWVWLLHGFLHIRRFHFSMVFTSIGCFGPPSPSLLPFHFSGLLARTRQPMTATLNSPINSAYI